jgi:hypothetical protein
MNCRTCSKPIVHIDAEIDARALDLRLVATCGHEVEQEAARDLWRRGMRWTVPVISGATLLGAERHRQLHEEGYTPEHDAEHDANDLTWAAWCLLDAAASDAPVPDPPKMWPWGADDWKPEHEPMRRLVIAGALIAAEIDRRLMESRMQK